MASESWLVPNADGSFNLYYQNSDNQYLKQNKQALLWVKLDDLDMIRGLLDKFLKKQQKIK